jgi:hypothetical protein
MIGGLDNAQSKIEEKNEENLIQFFNIGKRSTKEIPGDHKDKYEPGQDSQGNHGRVSLNIPCLPVQRLVLRIMNRNEAQIEKIWIVR